MQTIDKKSFPAPSFEIIVFDSDEIMTTSGGFIGEWDVDMPQNIDLTENDI